MLRPFFFFKQLNRFLVQMDGAISRHINNTASARSPPVDKEPSILVVWNRLPLMLVRDPETSMMKDY